MRKAAAILLFAAFLFPSVSLYADVQVDLLRSTGLALEGRKGYLSAQDSTDRFVVTADESPIYLLFFWDGKDLAPWVSIERQGVVVADLDLTAGNKVRLTGGGDFVCIISAHKGTGHWICVVLSGREWDN